MKTTLKLFLFLVSIHLLPVYIQAQGSKESDRIVGLWEVGSKKARIKIYRAKDDKYYGKIVWLREPNYEDGTPKVDKNNPDESKRNVPLLGYLNLRGFNYVGNNKWENGTIYDPENGSTYSCVMELVDDNTLDVRGFIGVQLFGRTDRWIRLEVKK
jgi:uncharacterized protein (DUF2147 family)